MSLRSVMQGVRDRLNPEAAEARKEEERAQEMRRAERRLDLRWLLSHPQGRRFAANLLTRCHVMAATATEKQAGRRDLGLELFGEFIGAAPEEALALFKLDPAWQAAVDAAKPKDAGKA